MSKPFIIAEIAQGYEGSEKLVKLLVKSAVHSGADAIKFQIFHADELALPDYRYFNLFRRLELPFEVWKAAIEESHCRKLEFYSDLLGFNSFKKLENIGVDGYKIHTTDINNLSLLRVVEKSKKKIFLSTGGCQEKEISTALDIFSKCNVTLMYGFQAEPTELQDNNLNRIRTLKDRYDRPVGFQDHTLGDSRFAFYVPCLALGVGIDVIEKHLTLSRIAQIEDFISALTPEEFKVWTRDIKRLFSCLGEKEWIPTGKELEYRLKVRRAVCTKRAIKRGKAIKENDIILKRTDNKYAIFELAEVMGKKARNEIRANSAIIKKDLI